MAQHLKLIALLIFTLSASYTSAQSLRKLLERPYGIIESKWEKDAQVDNSFKSASSYTFYRGKFPKDFNIQTPYALPVKNNQKTAWKTDPREPFKTLNFHIKQGDTIYATRSGIACISFFFLDENKFKGGLSSGYPYSHFIPVFRTTEGDVKPEEKTIYQAVTDHDLIMQDMSKRDKKKYMKLHNLK